MSNKQKSYNKNSPKVFIRTFGCQMNKSDSERVGAVLEKIKYKKASNINEADLIVTNMCSVRQSAVDRVYGLVPKFKKLKNKNSKLKTILTGCVLKYEIPKSYSRFPRVNQVYLSLYPCYFFCKLYRVLEIPQLIN